MIPLWYLLIAYFALVALAFLFLFFNLFDISHFGLQNGKTSIVLAVYTLSFLLVLLISASLLITIDWGESIQISQITDIILQRISPSSL
ncbi:MAG: hypothetical protein Q8P30_04345 [Candidatus Uhrbacteria bacterium]|nr:hypothetical protein [Candidatus Uhrbacteria bacterium]